jgi:hypothetical protein
MYTDQRLDVTQLVAASIAPAADIAASRYHPPNGAIANQLWAIITTVTAVQVITLTWKYRPTPGSDTNAVTVGTLNIPIATAVGKVVYKNLTSQVKMAAGGELIISAAGASATGSATVGFSGYPSGESGPNNPNAIASA